MTLTYVRLKSQNERMEAIFERILAAKFEELMKDEYAGSRIHIKEVK